MREYVSPGTFPGGTIFGVGINVGKVQYIDLKEHAAAAFAAD